jgi:predicted phage baseplate assembly protein
MAQGNGGTPVPHAEVLHGDGSFACFSTPPALGDALLIGLDDQAPSCAVAVRFECEVKGVGVNPRNPPLVWEAWNGSEWVACELDSDGTGGLNRPGDVVIHLPDTHTATVLGGSRAGWLRCRVVEPPAGYPSYSASPTVRSASAFTIGGSVPAVHAETITDEVIGMAEGVPGESFELGRRPVVPGGGEDFVVEIAAGPGWESWREVDSFAGCGPDDQVVVLDRTAGTVHFPPAVREPDGSLRHYGAVPHAGSPVRVPRYRTGGGPRGNVAARAVSVLRSTIPFVNSVENRRAAHGGVAPETIEQAKVRGPLALRTRDRAITAEDYEQLAKRAAPDVARVRCIPAMAEDEAGGVRVLVVPAAVPDKEERLSFEDLIPDEEMLSEIASYLDERRPVGARVLVEPPFYRGVTVVARLTARPRISRETLQRDALRALYRYFDPIRGGPDGDGWPFGRPVHAGEVHAVLQGLAGTEIVDEVLVFAANPTTGRRGEPMQQVEVERNALVFSFDHRVRVSEGA